MPSLPVGQGSASQPKRDRDLLVPDEILGDADLDNIWDWFASAVETNVDRQLIFVKLVNSVRKPYLDHCRLNLADSNRNLFPSRTVTSYTPSVCTIMDHAPGESQSHEDGDLEGLTSQNKELKLQLEDARADLAKKDNEIHVLETKFQTISVALQEQSERDAQLSKSSLTRSPSGPHVAIMSAASLHKYIQMDGREVSSYEPSGSGIVSVQPHIWTHETFEIEYYPDGIIAFKSVCFQNVYLRATCNPWELLPGFVKSGGGGIVNCQYISEGSDGCSIQEKFRIHPLGHGQVAIEPVAFPGRYLSLDATKKTVTLQAARGDGERFYLIFVTFL
ncbi:hypothetical protein BDZ91DRAFT_698970 [Kalaharituber pfeilii]|nr:hypothetical protein BDZ91DRAFT_698970 [Kalaharituber pfeilii]